jgi:ABC-type transport system involved in Fe-S cluster assembly fused permease/ATPase subunit
MTNVNKSEALFASEGYDVVITTSGLVNRTATTGEWSWKEGKGTRGISFHSVNTVFNQSPCMKVSSNFTQFY